MTAPPITRSLASYAAHGDPATGEVRADVELMIADYLGVAIRGSQTDSAAILARTLGTSPHDAGCTLIGSPRRAEPALAAMTNAVAAHSVELDDVDRLALFHFSPPVVSAALAAGETLGASGAALVDAVVVGCEVMTRLSASMNNDLRDRGFHTTPVCGVFGATAAVGRLSGLDEATMASAFGLAGAQAGGLMQMYGPSMQKRFNPGPAARDGVMSAMLAQAGFEGADDIIEGERGVIRAFTSRTPDDACLADLGERSWIDIEFKPYACARPIHNAIDTGLAVREQVGGDTSTIVALRLERHPDWAHYHVIPEPRSYHEAQVSVNYGLAVGLARGSALFDDFAGTVGVDAEVARLARLVEVSANPELMRGVSCRLTATLADGRTLESTVDYPTGSDEFPLGVAGIERKFRGLASYLPAADADRAWEVASSVPTWSSVGTALNSLPVPAS